MGLTKGYHPMYNTHKNMGEHCPQQNMVPRMTGMRPVGWGTETKGRRRCAGSEGEQRIRS